MKLIAITSPATDAGKTFIAVGIAEAATQQNLKTLFVDFDNPVGDSLRVFGVSPQHIYPTLGTYKDFQWQDCVKSAAGTYILPKPNMLHETIDAADLLSSATDFDLVVADLGTDHKQQHWETIINQADLTLLVSDCDEKALVRLREFLNSRPTNKDWTLVVNSREKKSYYTESQIARELSEQTKNVFTLPYFPDAEKKIPKTPDSSYMAEILSLMFDGIKIEDKIKLQVKLPQLPQLKKGRKALFGAGGKNLFGKSGQMRDGEFIKLSKDRIKDGAADADGIIISASWGTKFIKDFRREYPLVPMFVLGGRTEHLKAGADRCVKKINSQVISEAVSLSERMKHLWSKVETDPLTGLYTRDFLTAWMRERENPYSAVILDIDKFKAVNDTYGHQAGDMVLSLLGGFLKQNLRFGDIACRYGGEEFVICLPDTTIQEGYIVIDRLRKNWSSRKITLEDGSIISCTYSAGIAEWPQSRNVLAEADKRLYEAKSEGRNRVCASTGPKVLLLGDFMLNDNRMQATSDPNEAIAAISSPNNVKFAPGLPLYVIPSGAADDWVAKKIRPDAVFCENITEAVNLIVKPKLAVLPGARGNDHGMTIPIHGALYVVSPSRPALAGEIAAALCEDNTALVCASPESMAAVSLGIPPEKLVVSDWRFPGGQAPIEHNGVMVWPIDPYKYVNTLSDAKNLADQIKSRFSLVIIDCASSLDMCSRVARDEGILVLAREGDASDQLTQQWLKTYGGPNVAVVNPSEGPALKKANNGYIIGRTSEASQRFG